MNHSRRYQKYIEKNYMATP